MELQPKTNAALSSWLDHDTWYTSHDNDMNRFYDFVNMLSQEHGLQVDSVQLQDEIERQARTEMSDPLRDIIRTRVSLAVNILDFLRRTHEVKETTADLKTAL